MSYSSGEAAEQVVRMTLNGVEVAAKISGKAAERLAVLLYAVLQDQKKTRGKTRLTSMLKSGKELKVFSVSDGELERFCREAKSMVFCTVFLKIRRIQTVIPMCLSVQKMQAKSIVSLNASVLQLPTSHPQGARS